MTIGETTDDPRDRCIENRAGAAICRVTWIYIRVVTAEALFVGRIARRFYGGGGFDRFGGFSFGVVYFIFCVFGFIFLVLFQASRVACVFLFVLRQAFRVGFSFLFVLQNFIDVAMEIRAVTFGSAFVQADGD